MSERPSAESSVAVSPELATRALSFEAGLDRATLSGLRVVAWGVLGFPLVHLGGLAVLPGYTSSPWVLLQAALVMCAAGALLYALRGAEPNLRWLRSGAIVLSSLIAATTLSFIVVTRNPEHARFLPFAFVAAGLTLASPRVLLLLIAATLGGWALLVAPMLADRSGVLSELVAVGVGSATALVLLFARRAVQKREYALRRRDAEREAELREALASTEAARRALDRRVADRTTALSMALGDLREEFEARQRVERSQALLEVRVNHAARLESLGRITGGIAHDFNNLLTVITGNLESARAEADVPVEVREAMTDAAVAAERAGELVQRLLAFSRKHPVAPRTVDLGDVVRGVHKLLTRVLDEQIRVELEVGHEVARVDADPRQLEQVVMNLALNARDAMAKGGTLFIGVSERALSVQQAARHAGVQAGDYVCLTVRDSGAGIETAHLEHIFEPFFTTKREGEGTGLGLATVHAIVLQCGGFIDVRSEAGVGSTFFVFLPKSEGEVIEEHVRQGRPRARAGGETILIVEDDTGVRQVGASALRRDGYRVLVASDGAEALEVASRHGLEIDLLITDVMMPGMDGRGVADALLARQPGLRVLFTSGYGQEQIARRGVSPHGVNFIPKPYGPTALSERVRQLLEFEPTTPGTGPVTVMGGSELPS